MKKILEKAKAGLERLTGGAKASDKPAELAPEAREAVKRAVLEVMGNKFARRAARQRMQRDLERRMEMGVLGRGVPGFCGGLRPTQIRAAAKQVAMNVSSAALKQAKGAA